MLTQKLEALKVCFVAWIVHFVTPLSTNLPCNRKTENEFSLIMETVFFRRVIVLRPRSPHSTTHNLEVLLSGLDVLFYILQNLEKCLKIWRFFLASLMQMCFLENYQWHWVLLKIIQQFAAWIFWWAARVCSYQLFENYLFLCSKNPWCLWFCCFHVSYAKKASLAKCW